MSDFNGILNAIKQSSLEAVENSKPANIVIGKVVSVAPLLINVEQKLTLSSLQLILTRSVTDFDVDVSMSWDSENTGGGSGDYAFSSHSHGVVGRKALRVHFGLVVGDEVVLMRVQGGQKYVVLDKIGVV